MEQIRDKDDKAYKRERAAAVLKVAAGQSVRQVALRGLLQKRKPETVGIWLDRLEAEGLSGLTIRDGRGRKAAYEP